MLNSPSMKLLLGGAFASALLMLLLSPVSRDHPEAAASGDVIAGRYIVVLREGRDPAGYANALGQRHGFAADLVYRWALQGFAANLSDRAANAMRSDPHVLSVEPDRMVTVLPHALPTGIDRINADDDPTANIDGVDTELAVNIAVIDTGVDGDHPDLRVMGGVAYLPEYQATWIISCGNDGPWKDDHGHGTHVAGIVAARDNDFGVVGVAPGARIWAVKVLGDRGSGCVSDVIAGVDWATGTRSDANPDNDIDVANMSLGTGDSSALCFAIANSVAAGVTYVVAAGNAAIDAANRSPANCSGVITVSAIADSDGQPGGLGAATVYGDDDGFATFSNFGPAVDIAAPGVAILSTYMNNSYATLTGTSMASPHVAGAAALFIHDNPGASPDAVRSALIASAALQDGLCGFSGDPDSFAEPLVYVGTSCSGGSPADDPALDTSCETIDVDCDGIFNAAEVPCGSDSLAVASVPERVDGAFAGVDDDGDTETDEPLPPGSEDYDCDGDGYTGTAEALVFSQSTNRDQDPCGSDGWPADITPGLLSVNKVDTEDLSTYVVPVRRLNTSPGDPGYDPRWDIVPGSVIGHWINMTDIANLVLATPPMLGGARAFNGPACPWPP